MKISVVNMLLTFFSMMSLNTALSLLNTGSMKRTEAFIALLLQAIPMLSEKCTAKRMDYFPSRSLP